MQVEIVNGLNAVLNSSTLSSRGARGARGASPLIEFIS